MPIIYVRWTLGICLRFGHNLSKMCPFTDFNRPKLDICNNLQQKHCIGEQIFLVVMELVSNAHHIREMDFGDLPQIWKSPMFHWGWFRGGSGVAQGVASYTLVINTHQMAKYMSRYTSEGN